MNNTYTENMKICPKYAQHILNGQFKTPLSTPFKVHLTIWLKSCTYIFRNCQKVIDH